MFSDHLRKIKPARGPGVILAVAGAVLIAVQLFGVAQVAGGQVQKAQQRELEIQSQRVAMENCLETRSRLNGSSCLPSDSQDQPASKPQAVSLTAMAR